MKNICWSGRAVAEKALMPFTAAFETAAALYAIRGVVGVSWAVVQSYMRGVVIENELRNN